MNSASIERVSVTPAMAEAWLSKSKGNRRLKEGNVQTHMFAIRSGAFKCSPDPILFDESGALRNGHHRLTACVRTGISIPVEVRYDASEDVISIIDTGTARSVADNLSLRFADPKARKRQAIVGVWSRLEKPSLNMSNAVYEHYQQRFPQELELATHCKIQSAVASAAFGYAFWSADSERKVRELLEEVQRQDNILGSPACAINRALGERKASSIKERELLFMKILSGVKAHLLDERRHDLKGGMPINWFSEKRKAQGLSLLILAK